MPVFTQSTVPRERRVISDPNRAAVRIIADYMLRFMRNNPDAKLYEAMGRLETKVVQFTVDGCDENKLRVSLAAALRTHTRAGLIEACHQLTVAFTDA